MAGEGAAIQAEVVGHYRATLTRRHVLVHLKAEDGYIAEGPNSLAANGSPVARGAVLEQEEFPLASDLQDGSRVPRSAAHMHHDDAGGSGRDAALDGSRVEAEGLIDIRQNRDGPLIHDRCQHRHPHVRGNDDLLARAHAQGRERDMQGARATRHGHGVFRSHRARELLFQLLDLFSQVNAVITKQRPRLDEAQRRLNFPGIHEVDSRELERQRAGPDRFTAIDS